MISCLLAWYIGMLAATGLTPSPAGPTYPTVNGLVVDPSSLDLGEIWETPRHTVTLTVKNVGSQERTITNFENSCDCVAVQPRLLTVGPGQTASISVSFDLTRRQPYQIGLARRPVSVLVRPTFTGDFASTPGWELKGIVRSRVTLETSKVTFTDQCTHLGPAVSRRIRAKAHVPINRLEASTVPDLASAKVERAGGAMDEYLIIVTPRPELPPGPFQFAVNIRAVDVDGVVHPCASIDASGEMQPTKRVFPRMILFGERTVPDNAEADITVRLPATEWRIDRIETDSPDTTVTRGKPGADGELRLRVVQRISRVGDQVSTIRIIVRKPDMTTEAVSVEVRYHGQVGRR